MNDRERVRRLMLAYDRLEIMTLKEKIRLMLSPRRSSVTYTYKEKSQ